MAAEANISIIAEVSGLGKLQEFAEKFATTTAPTALTYNYRVQASATDNPEALDLGDISTVHLIILKCVSNDIDIDTSYATSFSAEIEVQEGEVAIFKPTGTVYIQNDDTGEQSTYEYLVIGTT